MHTAQRITPATRVEWRKWLEKHHLTERRVEIVVHKRHTGKPAPSHRELLEEAICFGWIDTTIHRIDEDTFLRHFVKRNESGRWSDNTLRYAKDLIKQGKMTSEGMRFYKLGLAKPTHDHGIPKNPDMPPELKQALAKSKKAEANFKTFSPSAKRTLYRWFLHAKRPETRKKRVAQIVAAALGKRNIFSANEKMSQ